MSKCKYGYLKKPVKHPKTGVLRRCKIKPKTKKGLKMDRKRKSQEDHEIIYRRRKKK